MHPHMEQSFSHPRNQQQDVVLGWTQAPFLPGEANVAPSQSASSAVVSPGSGDCGDSPSHSLGQSSTSLKERDYIGLAEVSSAPPHDEREQEYKLYIAETDLRLGLGPSKKETPSDRIPERRVRIPLASSHASDDAKPSPSSTWHSTPHKSIVVDAMAMPHVNSHQSSVQLAMSKNGGKRMYAEAMVDASRDSRPTMNVNSATVMFNTSESRSCVNPLVSMKQPQDPEVKPFLQGMFRTAPHVVSWQHQNDQRSSSYRSLSSQKNTALAMGEGDGEVLCSSKLEIQFRCDSTNLQAIGSQEDVHDEAPPAKGQVVGWPPVRSYRRSTLAARLKPGGEEGDSLSTIYVKVNMDGIPIGRKVDLSAYKSYDGLLSALEDMFRNPNGGYGAQFLKGSEFVLTYEDKEGDWMLVGDVPWGMFVNTVRRLRITRGPDMAGLGHPPAMPNRNL